MNFTHHLVNHLADKNLLKHDFYQAWNCGSIPMETLQLYAQQYYHHVKAFPRYISATHSQCEDIRARQLLLENLNDEENGSQNHPELWMRFAEGLGESRQNIEKANLLPETQELINTFFKNARQSYAAGLGSLFAYEHQIPEIATFKIEALRKHYSIESESTLAFFEVHRMADVYHTATLKELLDSLTPSEQQEALEAAKMTANQLWKFLDGIQRSMLRA